VGIYYTAVLIYEQVTVATTRLHLFSKLEPMAQKVDEKKEFHEWRVPKNTPVNDPKAVEQTVPPRCAMQGPICGEPPL
jgi:hypothetical protein